MNKKSIKKYLVLGLILIEMVSITLAVKSFANRESVDKTQEENVVDKKSFGMYVENTSGNYVEYNESEYFPDSSKYTFNSTKSQCIDSEDNVVENVITFSNGQATINSNKTLYCYLYFDLERVAPTVTATINDNNTVNPTMSITSNEAGTYCVNTDGTASTMTDCLFQGSISANTAITTSAFTTDGTYYAHVQDSVGNIGISSGVSVTVGVPAGDKIQELAPTGLSTTAYNGMYRFVGTSANNYVSIGGVSYRIIGITSTANSTLGLEAGQIKVIKTDSIGTYNWHTSHTVDATWNTGGTNAAMYTYLNGTVLSNTTYIPSGWSDKISSVKWYVGDVTSYTNASTIIGLEDNTVTSSTSKIGLMYLSDYYYAQVAGGTTNCYSTACSNWLTLGSNEWTMLRYGYYSAYDIYRAWRVASNGGVGWTNLNDAYAVRPVFFLTSDVQFVGGTGTSGDPFIVE